MFKPPWSSLGGTFGLYYQLLSAVNILSRLLDPGGSLPETGNRCPWSGQFPSDQDLRSFLQGTITSSNNLPFHQPHNSMDSHKW